MILKQKVNIKTETENLK